ncbi:metal-dependent hydrolase [Cupriavidus necator]|uniref:metal-dependent hydrolase n=1 Tax=Cupriavidus necator TaxID=106590 RepID=UPI00339DA2D1
MDTITHALMGAQAALAMPGRRLDTRERLLLGAAAGAFPDADFLGFLIHPLRFLAQWHQGPTHSLLLLLPVWAGLLTAVCCLLVRRRTVWREALAIGCVGLASHIALDLITVYGTRILYPWSERRFSLGTSFLVDPLLSAIVVAGLALALFRQTQRRRWALAGMALLCAYVGGQGVLRDRALELGNESLRVAGIQAQEVDALPQPFSPFNWKLIARVDTGYRVAHINLAGHPAWVPPWQALGSLPAMARAYVPPERMAWTPRPRLPDAPAERALAWQLWMRPDFADFRQFAAYPALSAISGLPQLPADDAPACVWFTDLRYDLPAVEDVFRYGYCRDSAQAPWRLHRLAYFSRDACQRLE